MTFKHKLSCRLALLKDRIPVLAAVVVAGIAAAACEKPVQLTDVGGGSIAQLVVSPRAVTLQTDQITSFTAVALTSAGDTATNPMRVSWSVTGGSITDTSSTGGKHYGRYKAAQAPGKYKVTASDPTTATSDTATVTVIPVPVASVTVSPASPSLRVGTTVALTATTLDSAGNTLTGRTLTWSSSNGAVATVSGSGVVTGAAVGTATITATSEGKSGSATITVSTVPVATVTVAPPSAGLNTGQTVQLSATTRDSLGNVLAGRVVTWGSSAPSVATVTSGGLVTGVAAGTATMTATSEGKSGTSAITVTFVPVATVTVTPASANLAVGQTVQLTATTKDANGNTLTGRTITWSSGNTAVATVTTSGSVKGVTAGSATITATSEGQSGTAAITVPAPAPVASVSVNPASASVQVGQTVQLVATPRDANGNPLTGRTITWGSSNTAVATVTASGLVTGLVIGSATITATSEGQSGSSAITVTAPPIGNTYYTATTGLDANAGTLTSPFKTIAKGASVLKPGDKLY